MLPPLAADVLSFVPPIELPFVCCSDGTMGGGEVRESKAKLTEEPLY